MMKGIALGFVFALIFGWAWAQSLPAPDELTEFQSSIWEAGAEGASAQVFDDTDRVRVGEASLRFETDGGFDTWLLAPASRNANWDFSVSGGIAFWVYAENNNIGFQNNSPWIRLHSSAQDYIELHASYDILNEARGNWRYFEIPLSGNNEWRRTIVGTPDLSAIRWIEIHADTWEAGFRLWIDGLRFDLPISPPAGQMVIAGNMQVSLSWLPVDYSNFSQYEIYRALQPFEEVQGMSPIAVITDREQTSYIDTAVVNGVRYYYAVAVRLRNGQFSSRVPSIGPRTPYNETDLQVVSIARLPRYPRYDPIYTYYEITEPSGFGPYIFTSATDLGSGQDANTQRWPHLGEQIAYVATVRNRGTNPWNGTLTGRWEINSTTVAQQSQPVSLAPNQTCTFTLTQVWDGSDPTIRFVIDVADARPSNNALERTAKSVGFLSFIDRSRIEDFREETPNYPNPITDDFIDWINAHMARFNAMFAEAGTPKRVHFEVLEVLNDTDPDPDVERIYFAIFPFRYYSWEGSLRLSGYYSPDEDLDYGLLHEMGHQLGLIDLYRLNLVPEQNWVNGLGYSGPACLMNGVSHFLSEHSARAMTHWYETAHGYYGQYLYALPQFVKMRFLGFNGQPLQNATVRVYQKCERPGIGEVITNQMKASGTTDANGEYLLPNVPIDPDLVPPAFNGDILRDNPFGYVAVVGTNGVLLFEVEKDGYVDYAWLDITEVNNAYWSGQTGTAVFTRSLSLGGSIRECLPFDMAEGSASAWSGWAQDGTITLESDTNFRRVGQNSLRVQATGGFDNYVRYPANYLALWNLENVQNLRFFAYAVNPNIGFQESSPRVRLYGRQGYIELRPTSDVLNEAIGRWYEFAVPLRGNADWQYQEVGTVSLSEIRAVQIHADTWGAGFTLWLDGVRFEPNPRCAGDVDGDGCVDDSDLLRVLFAFGQEGSLLAEDLNEDGVVDDADLLIVLFEFGQGC